MELPAVPESSLRGATIQELAFTQATKWGAEGGCNAAFANKMIPTGRARHGDSYDSYKDVRPSPVTADRESTVYGGGGWAGPEQDR